MRASGKSSPSTSYLAVLLHDQHAHIKADLRYLEDKNGTETMQYIPLRRRFWRPTVQNANDQKIRINKSAQNSNAELPIIKIILIRFISFLKVRTSKNGQNSKKLEFILKLFEVSR